MVNLLITDASFYGDGNRDAHGLARHTMTQTEKTDILYGHLPPPRLTVRIADATTMLGIGRSKLYEYIGAGQFKIIKLGTATLDFHREHTRAGRATAHSRRSAI